MWYDTEHQPKLDLSKNEELPFHVIYFDDPKAILEIHRSAYVSISQDDKTSTKNTPISTMQMFIAVFQIRYGEITDLSLPTFTITKRNVSSFQLQIIVQSSSYNESAI